MGARSQRRKEKHKKKRQEKKDQLRKRQQDTRRALSMPMPEIVPGGNSRHHQRVLAQVPQAWPGEAPEDVAIFDDAVLKTLSPDLADQATAVRDALQLACDSQEEEALKRTASIPRSSPYSQWRLFVRGLISWLDDDAASASESWERLDAQRRPARIATAMMNSLNPNLEQVKIAAAGSASGEASSDKASSSEWTDRLDFASLYHAKLLRRVRFDRPAVKLAEAGLRVPEEAKELKIGPRKFEWLKRFAAEYRQSEPDLVAALQQAGLQRASAQPYGDLFEEAIQAFEGPTHDRHNLLLSYFYYTRFDDDDLQDKGERCLEQYLKEDLPKNKALPAPLRNALISQMHLTEAISLIVPKVRGFMAFMMPEEDTQEIRRHFKASARAYPANRSAHRKYAEWVESNMNEDMTQRERAPHVKELAEVMENWSRGLPEDVKPRLWLVDYLLENERLDEAKPHVDWLAASRHDDPRVRAVPWKWQLLEAMRLCRRKAWFSQVPAHLNEAEKLWPAWLSRAWLPYLRAALALREGKTAEFEAEREQIWQTAEGTRGSLTDACMMLGAAQLMRVPANELKPFRAPVDQAVKNLDRASEQDLIRVGSFFWDLHRAQLLYPAYRMHGKKIADQIQARIRRTPDLVLKHTDDTAVQAAVLLCSQHGCFEQNYSLKLPQWFSEPVVRRTPRLVAAQLKAILRLRYQWSAKEHAHLGPLLREAAKSERDPYYRYWFVELADDLDEVLKSRGLDSFGINSDLLDEIFGGKVGDDEDDEDDEDEDEADLLF